MAPNATPSYARNCQPLGRWRITGTNRLGNEVTYVFDCFQSGSTVRFVRNHTVWYRRRGETALRRVNRLGKVVVLLSDISAQSPANR